MRLENRVSLRHSSLKLPLKASTKPFCIGLPGAIMPFNAGVPPLGKRGADAEAIGRSRGGRSTKIHAVVDACGRPVALQITPGQRGDAPVAIPHSSLYLQHDSAPQTRLTTATLCATSSQRAERTRSFPTIQPESETSLSIRSPTAEETSSNAPSAASRIGDASPHDMTSSCSTSQQLATSPLSSHGGSIESGA